MTEENKSVTILGLIEPFQMDLNTVKRLLLAKRVFAILYSSISSSIAFQLCSHIYSSEDSMSRKDETFFGEFKWLNLEGEIARLLGFFYLANLAIKFLSMTQYEKRWLFSINEEDDGKLEFTMEEFCSTCVTFGLIFRALPYFCTIKGFFLLLHPVISFQWNYYRHLVNKLVGTQMWRDNPIQNGFRIAAAMALLVLLQAAFEAESAGFLINFVRMSLPVMMIVKVLFSFYQRPSRINYIGVVQLTGLLTFLLLWPNSSQALSTAILLVWPLISIAFTCRAIIKIIKRKWKERKDDRTSTPNEMVGTDIENDSEDAISVVCNPWIWTISIYRGNIEILDSFKFIYEREDRQRCVRDSLAMAKIAGSILLWNLLLACNPSGYYYSHLLLTAFMWHCLFIIVTEILGLAGWSLPIASRRTRRRIFYFIFSAVLSLDDPPNTDSIPSILLLPAIFHVLTLADKLLKSLRLEWPRLSVLNLLSVYIGVSSSLEHLLTCTMTAGLIEIWILWQNPDQQAQAVSDNQARSASVTDNAEEWDVDVEVEIGPEGAIEGEDELQEGQWEDHSDNDDGHVDGGGGDDNDHSEDYDEVSENDNVVGSTTQDEDSAMEENATENTNNHLEENNDDNCANSDDDAKGNNRLDYDNANVGEEEEEGEEDFVLL